MYEILHDKYLKHRRYQDIIKYKERIPDVDIGSFYDQHKNDDEKNELEIKEILEKLGTQAREYKDLENNIEEEFGGMAYLEDLISYRAYIGRLENYDDDNVGRLSKVIGEILENLFECGGNIINFKRDMDVGKILNTNYNKHVGIIYVIGNDGKLVTNYDPKVIGYKMY